MFDRPDGVDAQLIGKLDLVQGFLKQAKLRFFIPRAGQLVLVEDAEFHVRLRKGEALRDEIFLPYPFCVTKTVGSGRVRTSGASRHDRCQLRQRLQVAEHGWD